ncbi:MAG: hypothetical protein DME04_03180 [Candidatus Rokuibacteriota bacterium]|nr:MAG: hypothetical protein DME04_03180 [Candidatus Rokubacteria bacterium]
MRLIKWAQGLGFTLREIGELARIPSDHVRGTPRASASVQAPRFERSTRRSVSFKQ